MKKRLKLISIREICGFVIAIVVLVLSFYAASKIDFYGESAWISLLGLLPIFTASASILYITFALAGIKEDKK